MRIGLIPDRRSIVILGTSALAVLGALLLGVPVGVAAWTAAGAIVLLGLAVGLDFGVSRRAWRQSPPTLTRRLPAAFALAVQYRIHIVIDHRGPHAWHVELHDTVDAAMTSDGLPLTITVPGGTRVDTSYAVTPIRRGEVTFAAAQVRVRSRWGLCQLLTRIGSDETRRVYPDFAQVARYAWLAGDHRLQEIGIKLYQQRGQGTDFKQLSEYRVGDPVRHIDWRATLRLGRPIVREFQDERDQCVMLLVDCGRRMRADDRSGAIGTTHFDQVLNAVMLLTYVALKQGDAVGALTFGTPAGAERAFAPRKGAHTLNALVGQLYDVDPTPTHSDYVAAAQHLLRRQHKRALVVMITNFRDEDGLELQLALRLLRSRHLVLLASLRERIAGELIAQPLTGGDAAIEVASAHWYEQARRDAFNRLAAGGALMVDAEPEQLGIALVNRYHAIKRAGLI
jgi:uncharacterized protein (DUF58 family)